MINKQQLMKGMMVIGLGCFSTLVFANELTIRNNTKEPSTSKVRRCTTDIPSLGDRAVTKPGTENHISENDIRLVCSIPPNKPTDCHAEVYMNDHCNGSPIAEVDFSKDSGVKKVEVKDNHYSIDAPNGSFYVQINYR